jgi:CHRD domain
MSKFGLKATFVGGLVLLIGLGSYALAEGGSRDFKGKNMSGYVESPAVSSVASGSFEAKLSQDGDTLSYELSYGDLEASVSQAHIHIGNAHETGGITLWLCETAANPDPDLTADTPTCPQSGPVTGELEMKDVKAISSQGIAAGEFEEVVAAMRGGHAYANVHTSKFPPGEIRAQISDHGDDD